MSVERRKTYVLDTNVLLSDAGSIFAFQEHHVIIPLIVLEELDRHKGRSDEAGWNARQVVRSLDKLRSVGNLMTGVPLPDGGTLTVTRSTHNDELLAKGLDRSKTDNLIISVAAQVPGSILVSKDINVRVKCDSLGVGCDDYLKLRVADDPEKFYTGVKVVEVSDELIDAFYRANYLDLPLNVEGEARSFYPNQIVIIKHVKDGQTQKSALTKCTVDPHRLVPITKVEHAFGLKPRNKEQSFSLDLLFDPGISLLTLTGPSGCGKTLLAIAAGLEQLRGLGDPAHARYDKLIITRPVQPVGKDIGFLPGTLEEKMEPWIAPIRDNLSFLMDSRRSRSSKRKQRSPNEQKQEGGGVYLNLLQERGLIEVEAITFIRGRSIPNAFIIVDESQNLSMHELKTIITRSGDGTKIVLTGDIEQVDNPHVDALTNGLSYAVERFKEHSIAGHVTLIKGERSTLATLASKIL